MCNKYEPLRVEARLRTGVVSDRWLPLDGILFYQAHRDALGPQDMTTPGGAPACRSIEIPLKCVDRGTPNWFFACSWAHPQPWWQGMGRDNWNKRFDSAAADIIDFGGKRGKIITAQGRYKAYHMPVYYRTALSIHWYCMGDRQGIKHLLSTMTHIGKKTAQGWGQVIEWTVEPCAHDWSCYGPDGEYMRGLPIIEGAEVRPGNIINYGIRPSYYRRENRMMLMVPA